MEITLHEWKMHIHFAKSFTHLLNLFEILTYLHPQKKFLLKNSPVLLYTCFIPICYSHVNPKDTKYE